MRCELFPKNASRNSGPSPKVQNILSTGSGACPNEAALVKNGFQSFLNSILGFILEALASEFEQTASRGWVLAEGDKDPAARSREESTRLQVEGPLAERKHGVSYK